MFSAVPRRTLARRRTAAHERLTFRGSTGVPSPVQVWIGPQLGGEPLGCLFLPVLPQNVHKGFSRPDLPPSTRPS